jgi:hypothetical protein
VRWISDGGTAAFAVVLGAQLDVLREQMTADPGGGSATLRSAPDRRRLEAGVASPAPA